MTFKHTYEEMLDVAYKKLPDIIKFTDRFEVPVVSSAIQGSRTILKSFKQLAKALRREEEHFVKFMSRELATTGEPQGNDYIFLGKFLKSFMQDKVNKYTKEFVLCDKCSKPDTHLVKDADTTYKQCEACGNKVVVRNI